MQAATRIDTTDRQVPTAAPDVEVGTLDRAETAQSLGVISRGMRDNPVHVAALARTRRCASSGCTTCSPAPSWPCPA